MDASFLQDTLSKKVIFLTGKGGVGKTTLARAIAVAATRRGRPALIINYGLQKNFSDAETLTIDPLSAFREYSLRILKFEKLYEVIFENSIFQALFSAAPGLHETCVAGKIWDLHQKKPETLLIVDLPSSGHALSFFKSPLGVEKMIPVGFVHREASMIARFFENPETSLNFVAIPEELSATETLELKNNLASLARFCFGYVILNRCTPIFETKGASANILRQYEAKRIQEADAEETLNGLGLPMTKLNNVSALEGNELVTHLAGQL